MSSLNKAMIIGHLGSDPEVRYTQSNIAVATINIATGSRYKDNNGEFQERTEWHRCVAWARTAEVIKEYLKKGSKVYVEGPIETKQWEDESGNKKYTTEIKILKMIMLDPKNNSHSKPKQPQGKPKSNFNAEDFDDMDDDLPF